MEKDKIFVLTQYADAVARIKYLRRKIDNLESRLSRMMNTDYGIASDTVTCGKKGKKPLGTIKITGFRHKDYTDTENKLLQKKLELKQREEKLMELQAEAEEFIESVDDIEIRNILSLYYIDNLTWNQVALKMNDLYKKKNYTESACRNKHNRFLKKKL